MAKKINPKTFFKKLTQNAIVQAMFTKHKITDIPYATENMNTKERSSLWFNFYDSQDGVIKSELLIDFSIISTLSNEKSLHVLKSLSSNIKTQKPTVKSTEKPLAILAESNIDIAAAFFIEQSEQLDAAISISNFYTKSGWVRFKAHNKKPESLEYIDDEIAKAFSDSLLRSDNRFVRSSTYELNEMYYTRISSEDAPGLEMAYDADIDGYKAKSTRTVREICFVFIPSIGEVLVKASGNRETQYEYAEKYVRTLTGNGIEAKEIELDLSYFKNNTNTDSNYPIAIGNGIENWRIRSIELLKQESKHVLSMKFPNTKEDMYMTPMWMFLGDLGISTDLVGFVIKKISFEVMVQDNKNTTSKGGLAKVLVNMSMDHKSNLNMLLETHRKIDTLLQVIGINTGFKDMQVKEKQD